MKTILNTLIAFFITFSIQASNSLNQYAPFDQAGSYFDVDQGLIIGTDGLKYWHEAPNRIRNENGIIFKIGFFSIKSSDGLRYKKTASTYIKENWKIKEYPVQLSRKMFTFREDAGVDFKRISQAVENGENIHLSSEERRLLSAYLSVRSHAQNSSNGSFRTANSGTKTCHIVGSSMYCVTTDY